jgi:hypothetical protein
MQELRIRNKSRELRVGERKSDAVIDLIRESLEVLAAHLVESANDIIHVFRSQYIHQIKQGAESSQGVVMHHSWDTTCPELVRPILVGGTSMGPGISQDERRKPHDRKSPITRILRLSLQRSHLCYM